MFGNRIFKLKGKRNEILQLLFSNFPNASAVYSRELSPRYEEDIERTKFLSNREGDDIPWFARFFNNLSPRSQYAQGDMDGTSLKTGLDIVWNERLNSPIQSQRKPEEVGFCYRKDEEINADSIFYNEASKNQWAILHIEKQLSDNENMEIFFSEAFLAEIFGKEWLENKLTASDSSLQFSEVDSLSSYSGKDFFKKLIQNNELANISDFNDGKVDGKTILKNCYLYKLIENNFSEIEKYPQLKDKLYLLKQDISSKLNQSNINDKDFSLCKIIAIDVQKIVNIQKTIENFSDENKSAIEEKLKECFRKILSEGWPKLDEDIFRTVAGDFQIKISKFLEIRDNITKTISDELIDLEDFFKEIENFLISDILNNDVSPSSFDDVFCRYIRHFSLESTREKEHAKIFFQKIILSKLDFSEKLKAIKCTANSTPTFLPFVKKDFDSLLRNLKELDALCKNTNLEENCITFIKEILKGPRSILKKLLDGNDLSVEEISLVICSIEMLSYVAKDSADVDSIIDDIRKLQPKLDSAESSWYEFLLLLKRHDKLKAIPDFENSINNIVTNITNSKISAFEVLLRNQDQQVKNAGEKFIEELKRRFDKKANDTGELLVCLDKATELLGAPQDQLVEKTAAFKKTLRFTRDEKLNLAGIAFATAVVAAALVATGALVLASVFTFGLAPIVATIVGSLLVGGGAVSASLGTFADYKVYKGTLYGSGNDFAKQFNTVDDDSLQLDILDQGDQLGASP